MLRNKNLGNIVASEMEAVLSSDEYKTMFRKQADEQCPCPKECKCHEMGPHSSEVCGCTQEPEELDSKATIEVESLGVKEAFDNLVRKFVSLSEELDNLGFDKASASVLGSFDILLKEAAGESVESMIEQTLEDLKNLGPDVEVNVDLDQKEPEVEVDERLMEEEDEDTELMDLEETLEAMEELGLDYPEAGEGEFTELQKRHMKGLGLSEAIKQVDAWLQKHASAEDLESMDFELDADLSALLAEDDVTNQLMRVAQDQHPLGWIQSNAAPRVGVLVDRMYRNPTPGLNFYWWSPSAHQTKEGIKRLLSDAVTEYLEQNLSRNPRELMESIENGMLRTLVDELRVSPNVSVSKLFSKVTEDLEEQSADDEGYADTDLVFEDEY